MHPLKGINAFDAYLQHKLLDYQTQNIDGVIKSTYRPWFATRETDVVAEWRQNHHVTFPRYDCISPWLVGEDGSRVGNDAPLSSPQTEDVFEC